MEFSKIKEVLNDIAPLSTQEDWDNSGVQVCCGHVNVKKALIALEINNEVIDEAIKNKVELIIAHHPMLFDPIKSICPCDHKGAYIIKLIKNNISVFSLHTPYDKVKGGLNDYFLEKLGLKNIKQVSDFARVGNLPTKTKLETLAKKVAKFTDCEGMVRVFGDPKKEVKKVGIVCGGGSEFYTEAMEAGADVFITGDVRHHLAWNAKEEGMCMIDALHWGTEKFFVDDMYDMLNKKIGKEVKLIKSKVNQNAIDFMA